MSGSTVFPPKPEFGVGVIPKPPVTAGMLIDALSRFPRETEVRVLWDQLFWEVHRVEPFGRVVVIDAGSGDGDWCFMDNDTPAQHDLALPVDAHAEATKES